MRTPPSTLLKYYVFQVTYSVGFIWPIFTLFLRWNDLTYTQIGLLGSVSAVLVVVLEIPTGYIADRVGRRNAIAFGMAAMSLSLAGFVLADALFEFVLLYSLWSVALAFHSGSADAWLYETLAEEFDDERFTQVRGRGGAVHEWASAVTMILGGLLYVVHPTYPFIASVILHTSGIVAVLSMPKNESYRDETDADTVGIAASLSMLRTEFSKPSMRLFVVYVAVFFGISRAADEYIQPITVDLIDGLVGGDTIAGVELAEPAVLGLIYAGFALVASVASYHTETLRSTVGLRMAILLVPAITAIAFIAPVFVPLLAIPVFFLVKSTSAMYHSLVGQYLNDHADSVGRATILSSASMVYALVRAPLMPLAGYAADTTSPITAIGLLGVLFLLVAVLVSLPASPVATTETGPAKSVRSDR
nr:MFS transporter [Natrinema salaciae]